MRRFVFGLIASVVCACAPAASAQSFTYQGLLSSSGTPNNTPHDFEFLLFSDAVGGSQLGATSSANAIPVTDGRFTAEVNPGTGIFVPSLFGITDFWLEIAVRPTGGGAFTTLAPRQKLTPAPLANRAINEWLVPSGSNTLTNDATRSVMLFNRTNRITSSEYFGFTAPVPDFTFGGMYVNTPGNSSLPFYGYSIGNGSRICYTYFQGSTQTWIVNNLGDHLAVQANGNVGIGVPINSAATKLDVGGTVRATQFAYAFSVSNTRSIPGCAFRAADSSHQQISEVAASGTYLAASVASGTLMAPLDLPDGAIVTNITAYVYDNGVGAFTLRLIRRPHGQFGQSTAATSANSINTGVIQTISAAPNLTIANGTNSYYLSVEHGDWQGGSSSLFSATITYSVAAPQ